jgi:hypothetical protein
MFAEIYFALQQGRVLQQRWLEEAAQARRGWWAVLWR